MVRYPNQGIPPPPGSTQFDQDRVPSAPDFRRNGVEVAPFDPMLRSSAEGYNPVLFGQQLKARAALNFQRILDFNPLGLPKNSSVMQVNQLRNRTCPILPRSANEKSSKLQLSSSLHRPVQKILKSIVCRFNLYYQTLKIGENLDMYRNF